MNNEEWKDYKELSGEITEKLDNTATYESWLIIQEYVDRCQEKNKKYKEVIDKAIKKMQLLIVIGFDYDGFNQVDSFKTLIDELVGYAKESLNILKEVDKQMMNEEDIERGIKALYQMSKEKNFKSPTKKMTTITMNEMANEIEKLKKQQKEFIEWLENLINNANKVLDNPKEDEENKSYVLSRKFVLEHVSSKYKEIIGGKEYCVEKDENAYQINVSHNCKYINLLNEYQNWLAKEKEVVYRDCGHTQKAITKCYDKLVYLRKIYKDDYDIG